MTLYGILLAMLTHEDRVSVSPSYPWVVLGLGDDDAARRRAARRIHGPTLDLLLFALWRAAHPRR